MLPLVVAFSRDDVRLVWIPNSISSTTVSTDADARLFLVALAVFAGVTGDVWVKGAT